MRRTRVGLMIAVLALALAACSSANPSGATRSDLVFRAGGPTPSFSLPSSGSGSGSGRCSMDYRSQVSLLDAAPGTPRWTTEVPWGPSVSVTDGQRAFIDAGGADGSVAAMRLSDGRPLWQRPVSSIYGAPQLNLAGQLPIFQASSSSGHTAVVALSPEDGTQRWSRSLSGRPRARSRSTVTRCSPAMARATIRVRCPYWPSALGRRIRRPQHDRVGHLRQRHRLRGGLGWELPRSTRQADTASGHTTTTSPTS